MGGGRPPGYPKTGGRQKGTPNKTGGKNLDLVKNEIGYEPIQLLARWFMEEQDLETKLDILKELCAYCHAKPKAIEVTGADGADLFPAQEPRTVEELAQIALLVREAMHPKRIE